jgi:glycosyltransferase involved in cell wall biosynthesis
MASPRRLIFVGRMERLKGGSLLLESLPIVVRALERPIHLTMVGTGREEQAWRRAAAEASKADSRIHVDFTGWLGDGELAPLLARSDLLVVPSIWPEPFGLVGLEAAAHGVPAVAFDVGGIREWLTPGLNGIVAPGRPPTAAGLAGAIGAALADDPTLHRLGAGAFAVAARFAERRHVDELVEVFGTISDPTAVGGAPGVAHPPVATGPGASRA